MSDGTQEIDYFVNLAKQHAQMQGTLEAIAAIENPDNHYELTPFSSPRRR
jgi:hypothetical protein